MNLLLDTHTLLWFIMEDQKLPKSVKARIEKSERGCFTSIATLWEIGIKYSLGRLEIHTSLETLFELVEKSGVKLLSISTSHIQTNSSLPHHHRDPFDRMIIAQSVCEDMTVVTKDRQFDLYDVKILWE